MKRLIIPALVLLLLALTACVDSETRVIVNPAGNGEIHETLFMKREMFEKMQRTFSTKDAPAQERKLYQLDKLKSKASAFGEGVVYSSVRDIKTDDRIGYTAVYTYPDVTKLRISQDLNDKAQGKTDAGKSDERVFFTINKKGGVSVLTVNIPEQKKKESAESEGEEEAKDEAKMKREIAQLKGVFDGLRMALLVEVKGKVIKSDADHQKGTTLTLFDLNFSELVKDEKKLLDLNKAKPKTTDEMKALLKNVPGLVFESKRKFMVEFK